MAKLFRDFDWFWLAYLTALVWLWHPLWAGSQIPAFRDGFHFYYPQFSWLDSCYQSREYFPRWNPNEGLGASVWGQPTWQIFYPLRLLWLLPLRDLPQLYALWIIVHQIIATLGMKRLAFEIGLSRNAGWLAAVSFSLCCPVLFQYSNIVYLCSSAWIGWSLIPVTRILVLGLHSDRPEIDSGGKSLSYGKLFWRGVELLSQLGTACSMMVLSGDPQTAVNAALIGLACLAFSTVRFGRSKFLHQGQSTVTQENEAPRSSYSANAANQIRLNSSTARKGRAGTRIHLMFVARALTTVVIILLLTLQVHSSWKWFQVSSRCKQPLSVSDSVSPKLAALLTDDSALTTHRVFEFSISPWELTTLIWPTIGGFYQPVHTRWVDSFEGAGRMWIPSLYMGVIVVLMGIDRWRALFTRRAAGFQQPIEIFFFSIFLFAFFAATGSLYGWLITVIPGYDSFRYPAKWIVWACASLSISAAFQLDWRLSHQSLQHRNRLPKLGLAVVALGSLSCLSVIAWQNTDLQLAFSEWLSRSYDRMLGCAKAEQTIQLILFALHWPLAILCVLGIGLIVLPKRSHSTVLLLICLLDLCVSGRQWITTTAEPNPRPTSIAGRFSNGHWCSIRRADIRKLRTSDLPNDQVAQIELQQRFLIGKLGLVANATTFHAAGALKPWAVVKIERWLLRSDNFKEDQNELDEVLGHLGVGHRLYETDSGEFEWKEIESVRPFCEAISHDPGPSGTQDMAATKSAQVEWTWTRNSHLQVMVATDRECTLIIRQFNDGGWQADCPSIDQLCPKQGELFLLFSVPKGKHTMQISRRAFY